MVRAARLPRIVGYVIVGMVFAPLADAMSFEPLIDAGRIFVDLPSASCFSTWAAHGPAVDEARMDAAAAASPKACSRSARCSRHSCGSTFPR
jgi:hypothetical protein